MSNLQCPFSDKRVMDIRWRTATVKRSLSHDRHWTLDIRHWDLLKTMIQAIFFDFNGVIIDDEPLQMQVYQELLREQGIELTETDYMNSLGMDDETFVRAAYQRSNVSVTDDAVRAMLAEKTVRHRKLIENEIPFFPGACRLPWVGYHLLLINQR